MYAASLDSKETKQLVATSYGAVLSPGSKSPARAPYVLFVRNGALMAQEVDVSRSEVRGEPFLISDSLAKDGLYSFGDFSVSNNGILAFNSAVYQHEMIWLDRAGNRLGSGVPVDRYAHPALAPDNRKAVFERSDPKTGYMNFVAIRCRQWRTDSFRERWWSCCLLVGRKKRRVRMRRSGSLSQSFRRRRPQRDDPEIGAIGRTDRSFDGLGDFWRSPSGGYSSGYCH